MDLAAEIARLEAAVQQLAQERDAATARLYMAQGALAQTRALASQPATPCTTCAPPKETS